MNDRILGRTGLGVSGIAFGCGPTAALMIQGTPEQRREAVGRALTLGINYFDTAPGYGDAASEANLGRTLQELGARPHIATKVALEIDDMDDIAGAVVRSVEASLSRLRVPEVAVIQLHNRVGLQRAAKPEFGSGALLSEGDILGRGGVVEGFRRVRERGLARFFGCSAFGGDMSCVRNLIDSDAFDSIMVHYSLHNPSAFTSVGPNGARDYQQVGARAAARGMGVIALRVLEGGALIGAGAVAPKGMPEAEFKDIAALAGGIQARFGAELAPAETALRFALSNAAVSTTIVGMSNVAQVQDAAAWSKNGPLPENILAGIEALRTAPAVAAAAN